MFVAIPFDITVFLAIPVCYFIHLSISRSYKHRFLGISLIIHDRISYSYDSRRCSSRVYQVGSFTVGFFAILGHFFTFFLQLHPLHAILPPNRDS